MHARVISETDARKGLWEHRCAQPERPWFWRMHATDFWTTDARKVWSKSWMRTTYIPGNPSDRWNTQKIVGVRWRWGIWGNWMNIIVTLIFNSQCVSSLQAHMTQFQNSKISRFSWFLGILGPLTVSAVLSCHSLGDMVALKDQY